MSRKALLGLVLLGWTLRALPLLSYPLDYDEGCYFSACALWLKGCWPYRDFVLVHPPGLLVFLAPWGALLPSVGVYLARLAITCLGAANIAMVGLLSQRNFGIPAGYLSAFCYAIYPEVVRAERMILIEPLLNCFVLAALLSQRRAALWLGLALTVKAWAALWLVTSWPRLGRGMFWSLTLAGCLLLPIWWLCPGPFWQQVVGFQIGRPSHEASYSLLVRLGDILDLRHAPITLLALYGWWTWAACRSPVAIQVSRCWLLLVIVMGLGPGHFFQYNAHLAVAECFWAGAAWSESRKSLLGLGLSVSLAFALATGIRFDASQSERAIHIRALGARSLFCFDPGYGLLADRLPDRSGSAPVIVDSYATMLIDAGGGHATVARALADEKAQLRVRRRLQASQWVVVEERAREQMTGPWLGQNFRPQRGDLWRAR